MAKPDPQARYGKPGGAADQSTFAHGQAARGREDLDETAENAADWGLESKRSGVSKETMIGVALILVLLGAFGFVLYRKMQTPGEMLASIKDPTKAAATAAEEEALVEPLDTAAADDADPFGAFAQPAGAPRKIETAAHEDEWGFDQQEPPAQQETDDFADAAVTPAAGGNPFAAAKPASVQQSPPQADFNPFGEEPAGNAQTATGAKPAPARVAADQFEPFPEAEAAPTPPKTAAKAPAQISDPFGQPIGASANPLTKKAAPPQQIAEDDFNDFPPASGTQAAASTTVARPATSTPPADDFGANPFPSDSQTGEPFPDAFAEDDQPFEQPRKATGAATVATSAAQPARTAASAPAKLEDPWGAGAFPSSEPFKPNRGAGEPAPAVYEVRNGDNYWNISRKHYGTGRYYMALAEYNRQRISDPKTMRPGMKVMLPATEVLEARFLPSFLQGSRSP